MGFARAIFTGGVWRSSRIGSFLPRAASRFAFRLSPCSQCRAARGLMLVRARFRHLLEIPSTTDAAHSPLNVRRQSSGLPNAARISEPGTSPNWRCPDNDRAVRHVQPTGAHRSARTRIDSRHHARGEMHDAVRFHSASHTARNARRAEYAVHVRKEACVISVSALRVPRYTNRRLPPQPFEFVTRRFVDLKPPVHVPRCVLRRMR